MYLGNNRNLIFKKKSSQRSNKKIVPSKKLDAWKYRGFLHCWDDDIVTFSERHKICAHVRIWVKKKRNVYIIANFASVAVFKVWQYIYIFLCVDDDRCVLICVLVLPTKRKKVYIIRLVFFCPSFFKCMTMTIDTSIKMRVCLGFSFPFHISQTFFLLLFYKF